MRQETSKWYFLAGFLTLLVAAQAIHWLITPSSNPASYGRWWAVVAQAVLGSGFAVWFFLRARRLRRNN
jgi:uncharacterized membrane protein YjjP (DUF1212 family)